MLHFTFILVMAAHLLAVNIATAAPLVCIWLKRRELREVDETAGRLGRFLAWQSVVMLTVGIILGLAAAGLRWLSADHPFFEALAIVPQRRLWFGVVELLFFLVLMTGYAWSWPRVVRPRFWHPAIAVLAATNLIYHFPPLFAAIAVLQTRTLPAEELSYSGFLSLVMAPETLARVLHFLLASVAVTGTLMLAYSLQSDEASRAKVARWGSRLALAASLVQLLSGIFLLSNLPRSQQQGLLGGDWLATSLLATSGVAVVAMLHSLSALAFGDGGRRESRRSLWLMILIVHTMTAARHVSP